MTEYDTVIRAINISLSIVCIGLLLRKAIKYWSRYQTRTKDFWWVLMCWSLVVLFGSAEVLIGWNTSIRVFFALFAMALTLKVLLRPNELKHPTFTNEL